MTAGKQPPRPGCAGWGVIAYLAFAIYGWIDFARTNPDGLANLGLFVATFPVTIVDLILASLLGRTEVLTPSGHGYLRDHGLYYVPAVLVTAVLLWLAARAIERPVHRTSRDTDTPKD